jgi:AraC-like DNA-binding protein
MRLFLFLFLSLVTLTPSLSQNEEQLSQLSFDALNDSILKYRFTDFDKNIQAANAYILKGQREDDKIEEWSGMESIALAYYRNRNYKEANDQGLKTLDFARENNLPKQEMRSLVFIGDLQMITTSVEVQLDYYYKLLALAEAQDDGIYREGALNKIASVLSLSGDYEKAIEIRKTTLRYYEDKPIDSTFTEIKRNSALVEIQNSLALEHIQAKQLDSAKMYASLIAKYNAKEIDSCYMAYSYALDGEIAYQEKQFNEASTKYRKAYSICPSNYALLIINKAYSLGKIELGAKNYHEAIRILQQGLDEYQVIEAEEGFMQDYYEKLAAAYKSTDNFEKASYYYEKYLTTQEEYRKLGDEAKQIFIANERETFKKEFDIVIAEKEKKQTYLNYVLLGGSIVILTLLFFLLKFYRNKKADEAKFEVLIAKIKAAKTPSEIIDTKDAVLEEKTANDVSPEVTAQILEGLKKLEEKEYFLKQDCNSYNVAKKINTNTSYLSKVVNSHYGKNFNTYINDLRINYTILRLKNDVFFRSFSIQAIAEEVGYKSADSFTKYFKKDTGLNPSFYIKNIKNVA